MTAHTSEKPVVHSPETGWAKARRLRREPVRTCVPAVGDCGGPHRDRVGSESNIVRGED
ncbi:hypothetical protein [Streptomyces naganishii]|uniref:Uncharacterized protein n=1 Tax=Streptomyces naganishii JCM 4654 TaxID=1306179 RepID=A0A918Y3F1_9ACTN|nr:hypothetical protein [Streptomyces naganishii]GHD88391.1 hypothetical protein GCM10010508_24350 [Streptomyces naganishii JCM 4654]